MSEGEEELIVICQSGKLTVTDAPIDLREHDSRGHVLKTIRTDQHLLQRERQTEFAAFDRVHS